MAAARDRALVVSTPGDLRLVERDVPSIGPDEILVRPETVGLCGTDLEIIDGRIDPAYVRYPLVIGHEWAGTVVVARPGSAPAGTRVVVEGILPCGHCPECRAGRTNLCETYAEVGFTRDGAAAEHVAVPATLAHPLATTVTAEDAALVEPAAVVYRGLTRSGIGPGQRVLVVGDGTVALLAVRLLGLWSPAEVVVLGRRDQQAALASAAGAARFTTAPAAAGAGFDLVVEAAGSTDAVLAALAAARRGGTVVLLGLPPHGQTAAMAVAETVNNDLCILGSFSYTSSAWNDVVTLLNAGRLRADFLVTHRFPLAAWELAVATLRDADGPRGKVLLDIPPP